MAKRVRQAIVPAYLLLCLVLGGSSQSIWANALLQLIGVAMIAWAALGSGHEPLAPRARQLLWLLLAALTWILIQQVPLPASVWPYLGGRMRLAGDFAILGIPIPPMSISLAPGNSVSALLSAIPAIAVLCAMVRRQSYRKSWIAIALLAGTMAAILLGALQASNPPGGTRWYPYTESSFGSATGFFANANHMATLLVICLPLVAAMLASARRREQRRYSAVLMLAAAAALVLLVGLLLNKSIAGYALALPAIAASTLILLPRRSSARPWAIGAACLLGLAALGVLAWSPAGERALGTETSVTSRAEMLRTTAKAIGDFMPFGTGLGTFEPVYQLYEDHEAVTDVHVNHAHNDYAELLLETGLPGALLVLAFLAWWLMAAAAAWRTAEGGVFAKAGSIVSGVILIHSLVDFPLRTAAIGACFAAALGLMAGRRRKPPREPSELRPTRHIELR